VAVTFFRETWDSGAVGDKMRCEAVAVLAQGRARVVFAQLGHAVHAVAIQQGNALVLRLDQIALMADRAIDWIERLVRRAAFRQLGRGIDLVASRASQRLVRRSLEQVRGRGLQLLAVSLVLIGRMALHAGRVVEILARALVNSGRNHQSQRGQRDGCGSAARTMGTSLRSLEHRLHIKPRPQVARKGKSGLPASSFSALCLELPKMARRCIETARRPRHGRRRRCARPLHQRRSQVVALV
jgi:hypothetical protein